MVVGGQGVLSPPYKPPSWDGGESAERGGTRRRRPLGRTPPPTRRILKRLRRLAEAVRRERRQRGIEFAKAATPEEAALYTALLDAEDLLVAYKEGAFRSTPVDARPPGPPAVP